MGSLQPYIQHKRKQQVKARTLNNALQITRRILNLAATEWMDEHGLTWLVSAPKIKLFPETDRRPPYPLSWDEQKRFFDELPEHLLKMSLFTVNTGCRKTEVCNLRSEYEVFVPELGYSVFVIPGSGVKNRQDRVIVLNDVARSIVEKMRGQHSEFVFTYDDPKVGRRKLVSMLRSAWRKAREKIGLPQLRVHDLKHTFGRRLRSNKVCFEDRQDLLGHKSSRVTTDYSAAEILNLIDMANKACTGSSTPALTTLLKWRNSGSRAKVASATRSRMIKVPAGS